METVSEIFESLAVYALLQHLEGQPFVIPNIGEASISYRGETYDHDGKHAIVDVSISSDAYLTRCIGQLQDGVITDAERHMRSMNEKFLQSRVES